MKIFTKLAALACLVFSTFAVRGAAAAGPHKTDADGFILNWLVLEPIRLTNLQHTEAGIRAILARDDLKEPLTAIPKAGENIAISGANYQWHAIDATNYVIDLVGFATALGKPTVSIIFFGVAYVTVPDDMKDARLSIGSDDDSIWWINGKEVISAYGVRQTSTDDNVSKRLLLKKGVNIVRFAVVQGDGPSDCCARFFDSRQKAITNISVALDPPVAPGR
jgi:hypothetical protein